MYNNNCCICEEGKAFARFLQAMAHGGLPSQWHGGEGLGTVGTDTDAIAPGSFNLKDGVGDECRRPLVNTFADKL